MITVLHSTDYRTLSLSQKVLLDSNALSKQLTFSSTPWGEEHCWVRQNNYVVAGT